MILPRALPVAVAPAWREQFERRWSRARGLLIASYVLLPVSLLAVAGVIAAVGYSTGRPPHFVLLLVVAFFLVVPWGAVVLYYARGEKLRSHTSYWGLRPLLYGLAQCGGLTWLASDVLPQWKGVVSAGSLVVAVVSGFLAHHARSVLMDSTGGAIGATSFVIKHPMFVSHGPFSFTGEVQLHPDRLEWRLRSGRQAVGVRTLAGQLALRDITHVGVVQIHDPQQSPPVGVLSDGMVVLASGTVAQVRTPQGDVVLPVVEPNKFQEDLDQRLRAAASPLL